MQFIAFVRGERSEAQLERKTQGKVNKILNEKFYVSKNKSLEM